MPAFAALISTAGHRAMMSSGVYLVCRKFTSIFSQWTGHHPSLTLVSWTYGTNALDVENGRNLSEPGCCFVTQSPNYVRSLMLLLSQYVWTSKIWWWPADQEPPECLSQSIQPWFRKIDVCISANRLRGQSQFLCPCSFRFHKRRWQYFPVPVCHVSWMKKF